MDRIRKTILKILLILSKFSQTQLDLFHPKGKLFDCFGIYEAH